MTFSLLFDKEVFAKFAGDATQRNNGTAYPDVIGGRVDRLFLFTFLFVGIDSNFDRI